MSGVGLNCLVLNPNYTPVAVIPRLSTIPVEEAIVRIFKDNADCILSYNRKILTPSRNDLFWPSVIVNREFYKQYNDVRLRHIALFYRDHGRCQYCGNDIAENQITCDHVVPKAHGGKHEWENVVASCKRCNGEKDDNLPKGKWKPKTIPYKPSFYDLLEKRKSFPIVIDDFEWIEYLGGADAWKKVHVRKQAIKVKQDLGLPT